MELVTFNVRGTPITVSQESASRSPILKRKIDKSKYDKDHLYVNCSPNAFHLVINYLESTKCKVPLKYKLNFENLGIFLIEGEIDGKVAGCVCNSNFKIVRHDQLYCSQCKCTYAGCEKKKAKDSDYCSDHTCNKEDCNKKCFNDGIFCSAHGCSTPNCYRSGVENQKMCQHHLKFPGTNY